MSTDIAWWIAAFALMAVGLAGLVLPVIPGTPLLFAGFWLAAVVSLVLAAIMLMALLGRAVADADSKA